MQPSKTLPSGYITLSDLASELDVPEDVIREYADSLGFTPHYWNPVTGETWDEGGECETGEPIQFQD